MELGIGFIILMDRYDGEDRSCGVDLFGVVYSFLHSTTSMRSFEGS